MIGNVAEPPTDGGTPFAVRRKEISGNRSVANRANGPAREVPFDAEYQLANLVIIATQNPVGQAILVRSGRDDERRS